jgi:hypothetical protein
VVAYPNERSGVDRSLVRDREAHHFTDHKHLVIHCGIEVSNTERVIAEDAGWSLQILGEISDEVDLAKRVVLSGEQLGVNDRGGGSASHNIFLEIEDVLESGNEEVTMMETTVGIDYVLDVVGESILLLQLH